jgi:hypothetical protein
VAQSERRRTSPEAEGAALLNAYLNGRPREIEDDEA